jgi:hypothetical protein
MLSQLVSLMLAIPRGLDKTLSALHDKLSPSIHAKAALDAKVAMLAEMNAPNRRSKAMEKTLGLQSIHDTAKNNASSSLSTSYDAYDILKEKCIGCKLAEDALVSQLEVVISLHTTADEKLTEYNSAKAEAADASTTAKTLEAERDEKCGESESAEPCALNEDNEDASVYYFVTDAGGTYLYYFNVAEELKATPDALANSYDSAAAASEACVKARDGK